MKPPPADIPSPEARAAFAAFLSRKRMVVSGSTSPPKDLIARLFGGVMGRLYI